MDNFNEFCFDNVTGEGKLEDSNRKIFEFDEGS